MDSAFESSTFGTLCITRGQKRSTFSSGQPGPRLGHLCPRLFGG
ncbi:MAG: hypothetical protein JNN17_17335 [Verrucomicrobiaceae bacterium]|nr:hypothetical protein [Verrucomicrobiaceae bacterium]